jgi:hypothetical protein
LKTEKQNYSRKEYTTGHRRRFLKLLLGAFTSLGLILSPLAAGIRLVWAEARKIILPKGMYF